MCELLHNRNPIARFIRTLSWPYFIARAKAAWPLPGRRLADALLKHAGVQMQESDLYFAPTQDDKEVGLRLSKFRKSTPERVVKAGQ